MLSLTTTYCQSWVKALRDEEHLITTYIFTSLSWRTRGTTRTLGTLLEINWELHKASFFRKSFSLVSDLSWSIAGPWTEARSFHPNWLCTSWFQSEGVWIWVFSSVSVTGSSRNMQFKHPRTCIWTGEMGLRIRSLLWCTISNVNSVCMWNLYLLFDQVHQAHQEHLENQEDPRRGERFC